MPVFIVEFRCQSPSTGVPKRSNELDSYTDTESRSRDRRCYHSLPPPQFTGRRRLARGLRESQGPGCEGRQKHPHGIHRFRLVPTLQGAGQGRSHSGGVQNRGTKEFRIAQARQPERQVQANTGGN